MTRLDSSVIVDYLGSVEEVVECVDTQSVRVTSSTCISEVFAGEVFSAGDAALVEARENVWRVTAVDFSDELAFEAARLQSHLVESDGDTVVSRDETDESLAPRLDPKTVRDERQRITGSTADAHSSWV